MQLFPLDINHADKQLILRIPGIGLKSVNKIIAGRKFGRLTWEHLKKMGVAVNRARYFITCSGLAPVIKDLTEIKIRQLILSASGSKFLEVSSPQLSIF
jgi:predicted DNA-binding helix-hairpin-helix protein